MLYKRPPGCSKKPGGRIEEFSVWLHYTVALDPTHNQHTPIGQKDRGVIKSCRDHLSGLYDATQGTTRGTHVWL
jgi:hypothetical protein